LEAAPVNNSACSIADGSRFVFDDAEAIAVCFDPVRAPAQPAQWPNDPRLVSDVDMRF
jgi:hypothetical protein